MTDQFGRAGRRADYARLLHELLVEHGLSPLDGSARKIIDEKVAEVAAGSGVTEAVALGHLSREVVVELGISTADKWHASQVADEVASALEVDVPTTAAAQLVMGLSMAVGQLVREAYGGLPASIGEPLDALCEFGAALRAPARGMDMSDARVSLQTLSVAHRALRRAAAGVSDGSVAVVIGDDSRPEFAKQLDDDAELAKALQP